MTTLPKMSKAELPTQINGAHRHRRTLIESDSFPCGFVSLLAEAESWRKEIYRPIYHVHKWWAKRLGSVFRSTLLGSLIADNKDLPEAFYRLHDFKDVTVFDPFMGSGTTIGEAHKLGLAALGRDINPVACESVRVGLSALNGDALMNAFSTLSADVGERLRRIYHTTDGDGNACDVLYFFWVKHLPCPHCDMRVDLFPNYMFARNALPNRRPEVRVYCPSCGGIFPATVHDTAVVCPLCTHHFNAHEGPAAGSKATCGKCAKSFSIGEAVRRYDRPPEHRMYAKLVLLANGGKAYLKITQEDVAAYGRCSAELARSKGLPLPTLRLADGHNTKQAINYCYKTWRDFFNDRQLLSLGWLHQAILNLPDEMAREAMLAVFSGALEFNNMFASYKGEGTGAIRHMFAHHILKPERLPIEGNLWGTPKSSGSFSGLFRTRLFRALEYQAAPFEVAFNGKSLAAGDRKEFGHSHAFSGIVSLEWPPKKLEPRSIHISCGSSTATNLQSKSVDLVITDPPFFDNVHYSELADFFHAWQQLRPGMRFGAAGSTRHKQEVQDSNASAFTEKLCCVFSECHRVMKDDGLLVFSYHHSRNDGWASLAKAVLGAGFCFVNAHPVRAEMSVAAPKQQAKEPIQLDSLLICRKAENDIRLVAQPKQALDEAIERSHVKMCELEAAGFKLSINDRRVALMGQFLASICPCRRADDVASIINEYATEFDKALTTILPGVPTRRSISYMDSIATPPMEQLVLLEKPAKYKRSKRKTRV